MRYECIFFHTITIPADCWVEDCRRLSIGRTKNLHVAVVYLIFCHSLQHKVQIMTGTEPLTKDGSPPHPKARTVKLEMEDKMVQIIIKSKISRHICLVWQELVNLFCVFPFPFAYAFLILSSHIKSHFHNSLSTKWLHFLEWNHSILFGLSKEV